MLSPKPSIFNAVIALFFGLLNLAAALFINHAPPDLKGRVLAITGSGRILFMGIDGAMLVVGATAMGMGVWFLWLGIDTIADLKGWLDDDQPAKLPGKTWAHQLFNREFEIQHQLKKLVTENPNHAIPRLFSTLKDSDPRVRCNAAGMLAEMGTMACVPGVKMSLKDPHPSVVHAALVGIHRAFGKPCEENFRTALFDPLLPVLHMQGDYLSCVNKAADLLLRIDSARAVPVLLGEDLLSPHSKTLGQILAALNASEIPIPQDRLEFIAKTVEASCVDYGSAQNYAEVLSALIAAKAPDLEQKIRTSMDKHPSHAALFSALLLELKGLDETELYFSLIDREQTAGITSLNEQEQDFFSVMVLKNEWTNGGLLQYFTNSSADHAHYALRGLNAMGALNAAAKLKSAMDLFGPVGPSTERGDRLDQISQMPFSFDDELTTLEQSEGPPQPSLSTLCHEYVFGNASAFCLPTTP